LSDVLDINNEKDGQPYLLFYHKKQKKWALSRKGKSKKADA
jgi:hypothetical protein